MHRGWVRLYRRLQDNPIWRSEKFTPGQAWVDLFMIANYSPGSIRVRGNEMPVERGQVGWSKEALAERWRWSRGRVSRFLNALESKGMIVQQKSKILSIITILNYDHHQGDDTTDRTTDGTTDGQQTVQQTDTNKKDKNNKKVKKEYISPRLGEHENVKLTQAELDKLIERFTKKRTLDLITRLSDYLASKGDKYKSHYATMLSWARRDGSGATKPQAPTMTAEQEGKRKMLKNELSALHDKLEAKKQVPEGHPIYAEAKREIKWINKRIDDIEKELSI